ncbi:hypothetical protein BKA62DRAFT_692404 [Auriculariales sp. MPI-PUGE-AT-0066]|nr:hypothetical protein BKA62DRAFT_692404 [Auriculariales sp. MPI-PUGE-AT-0066]
MRGILSVVAFVTCTLAVVTLEWVDGSTPGITPTGTAFGLPWRQGEFKKNSTVSGKNADGTAVSIQTWPLAYWPDGTLKWTGHAVGAADALTSSITVTPSINPGGIISHSTPVAVEQSGTTITVTTGSLKAVFNTAGDTPIASLELAGAQKSANGQLVIHLQAGPEPELGEQGPPVSVLKGVIDKVVVEQSGPIRAVLKATGTYQGQDHAAVFPFSARFYIAAGGTSVRVVHFFSYDADQQKDFIKALGLSWTTPLSDALYDRHVRFGASDGGLLGEAVLGLYGLRRDATNRLLNPQYEGQPVPDISTWPSTISAGYQQLPVWNDWSLDQQNTERFTIRKRTDKGSKVIWLDAGEGRRSSGTGFVGGATKGGVGWALREAWQRATTGADIRGTTTDSAQVTVWAYSPRAPALDMRHYDTVAHGLDLTYEDVGNPDPDPAGIGRSYEGNNLIVNTPQLVASPQFYASRNLFGGRWNVPNTSTAGAAAIEKTKNDLFAFYLAEVEQRKWYGFWNFGDFMHTYDQTRHVWRYDVGGYAWDNGELGTDLWLWMTFLRTGRAEAFHIASAMTRHISEVDTHSIGTFAGLGSRHHVTHWGDGAKEARVGSATLRRPLYYLTTDELMGDHMDATLQVEQSIIKWEPLRKVATAQPYTTPTRVRIGPDWTAIAGNWFTRWERTLEPQWLEKIKVGMRDIAAFKYGMFTGGAGGAVGFDPATGHMTDIGGELVDSYHLTMLFGGGEFLMELVEVVTDVPEFDTAWVEFLGRLARRILSLKFTHLYAKLQAYAGQRLNNDTLKQAAWTVINTYGLGQGSTVNKVAIPNVLFPTNEIVNASTNDAASYSLAQYAILAIAPELAPSQ